MHWYLWRRLVRDTTAPGGLARRAGTVAAFVLPLTTVGALVAGRAGAPFALQRTLAWPGYLWLALVLYLTLALLVGEGLRPLLVRIAPSGGGEGEGPEAPDGTATDAGPAANGPGGPGGPGTSGASAAPDVSGAPGSPGAPGRPAASGAPVAPGAADDAGASGRLGGPVGCGVSAVPDGSVASGALNASGGPGASVAPGLPEGSGGSGSSGGSVDAGASGRLGGPVGCGVTAVPDGSVASGALNAPGGPGASVAPGLPEGSGGPGGPGTSGVSGPGEVPGAPAASGGSAAADAPGARGAPVGRGASAVPDGPGTPGTPAVPGTPDAPAALGTSGAPGLPESSDAVDAPGGPGASGAPAGPGVTQTSASASRRLFVARAIAAGATAVAAGTVGYGMATVLRGPRVKRVTVPLAKLPRRAHGFRIAVVSDIHLGPILGRAHTRRVVDTINRTNPDLIAVVGDLVDGSVADLGPAAEPLRGLRARHGSFFVTGNHEYFSGARPWVDHVRELGLRPLENERTELPGFDLAGVNDVAGEDEGQGPDFDRALGDRDRSRASVLLAHQPVVIHDAVDHGVDLQLSGHTHGGQMWPGNLVAALANPTVAGLERYGDTQLYVTRGAGAWGPPVRVGAPPDVTVVELASLRA
ncbi:metallophosphoesterase [Streptomyces sp. NA02950]|uniref:metallophosphoesterase n=1 Tax=Streptomyces sp. NA02950 TaxID=2742137 RepID=UPI0020CB53BC|nr:metallophosphoesterase [Streptomyces sp. NA02950]